MALLLGKSRAVLRTVAKGTIAHFLAKRLFHADYSAPVRKSARKGAEVALLGVRKERDSAYKPDSLGSFSAELIKRVNTILVIDDEPMVLSVVEAILRQEGYEVVSATGAQQGIKTATSLAGRIALVILNHTVSSTPALNLVEAIERLQPGVRVLRFSGYSEKYVRETGQMKPGSFFLQKPFTTQAIRKKVHDIIGPPSGSVCK
jgi:CheY-like chemotaxis protein